MFKEGVNRMDKSIGILLMVVFGVSGAVAAALAWFFPSLNLDKVTGSLVGLVGIGFTAIQGWRFALAGEEDNEAVTVEVKIEE
jgi:hypothetical protein